MYVELVIQPTTQGLKPKDEKLTEEELETTYLKTVHVVCTKRTHRQNLHTF